MVIAAATLTKLDLPLSFADHVSTLSTPLFEFLPSCYEHLSLLSPIRTHSFSLCPVTQPWVASAFYRSPTLSLSRWWQVPGLVQSHCLAARGAAVATEYDAN